MAAQTPQSKQGILRSPLTPGTGQSVRFGTRVYEDGDESQLTASIGSVADDSLAQLRQSAANVPGVRADDPSFDGSLSDMSFTESFLKREVGDALAGLDEKASPGAPEQVQTVRATRIAHIEDPPSDEDSEPDDSIERDEPTARIKMPHEEPPRQPEPGASVMSSDTNAHSRDDASAQSTSPVSSPGARGFRLSAGGASAERREVDAQTSTTPLDSPAQARATATPPSSPPPQLSMYHEHSEAEAQGAPGPFGPHGVSALASPAPIPQLPPAPAAAAPDPAAAPSSSDAVSPAPAAVSPAQASAPNTPELATPGRSTRTPGESSMGTSNYSWATPDSASRISSRAASPGRWPGMYELSHLTDKAELDEQEADALVPYDVEELSSKLVAIHTGSGDAKELLEMVVALDRTHSERTIFLQHRLARAYRMCQLLRGELEQAHERFTHVQEQVRHAVSVRGGDPSLVELVAQLEGVVDAPLAIESDKSLANERAALTKEREEIEAQRRDLEIRLAMQRDVPSVDDRIAEAVAAARAVWEREERSVPDTTHKERDAAIRDRNEALDARDEALKARDAAAADAESLREQLGTHAHVHATQDTEHAHADALSRWSVREMELVEQRTELDARCRTLEDTIRTTSETHTRQVAELERALLDTEAALDARHDADADMSAEVRRLRSRISVLEHDVSNRGIEIVRLEKARARLTKENLHYSLALSAKQQELELIKRGTENAGAYLRAVRGRPLRERSTNIGRAERAHAAASSELARGGYADKAAALRSLPRAPVAEPESPGTSTIQSSDLQSVEHS